MTSLSFDRNVQLHTFCFSRLLSSPITTTVGSIPHASDHRLLESLSSINADSLVQSTSAQQKAQQPHPHAIQLQQHQTVTIKDDILSGSVQSHLPKLTNGEATTTSGLVTVYNPSDGTLSLSLETARSLGIDVAAGSIVQQVSKGPAASIPAAASSVVMNNASLLPSSLSSDGTVTYILRSAPSVTW